MVTSYTREAYLAVNLLLSCDRSIYGKLVEDMGNIYAMGQYKYHQTLPNIQDLLTNLHNSAWTMLRSPTSGLAFLQERRNNEGTGPSKCCHDRRQIRVELDISTVK